ncbi:prophage tail fiber N-terminal domain-containing protein [Yersinia aleksiciae]|uniref:Phage protein n=1 Tax=Yersinia aleksiciae TaxID=263819 RepID=A0A0T9UVN6_YERAE|nr:prophage tail fiber N-terminal domain-containing protein [Yersinia aleksiciae]CNL75749.1 phage protein [Yersinia aleksiciae]
MSVTVSGIMINPVGEPVVNAQITLTAVANSLTVLNTFSVTVRTDNTGAYRIQLEEGSYSITVAANGRSFVYGAVTLDDTTGPSTLNQLLKQQIMESELTPDVILYFRQIQQQVANDLATIKVLENSTSNSAISAGHSRDEARQYASDLSDALALAKGYRDTAVDSATAAAESAAHVLESERIVIANANAAALSEANALQYKNYAQSAANEASTLAAEQTATKIKLAVKTDADRAEAAREDAETAQSAVDTQADEVNRLHTEVGQLALSAAGSSNSAAQSATESESSKNAAAQSKQAAVAAASVAENSANAAVGFRDEAEEFAARAKVSAESIDVSVLEERINEKVSQTVFDSALANKLTIQTTFLSTDLNLAITSGIYHPTAAALNLPLQALGVMEVYVRQGGTSLVQIFHATVMTVGNTNRHFVRVGTLSGGVWSFSAWAEQYTSLTMDRLGIGLPNQSDIANFDWQNFAFASGANYVTNYNTWVNPPAGVTYNAGTRVSIRVIYISNIAAGPRMGLEITPDTGAAANFKVYKLLCVGAAGSRVFTFNQDWNSANPIPITGGGTGGKTVEDVLLNLGLGDVATQITLLTTRITTLEADAFTSTKIDNTPWINMTLGSGWTGSVARYRKVLGMVQAVVSLSNTTITNGTTIATLPVGYRPTSIVQIVPFATFPAGTGPTYPARVVFSTDGSIQLHQTAGYGELNFVVMFALK